MDQLWEVVHDLTGDGYYSQVGRRFRWLDVFFPDHPFPWEPVENWTDKNRVDFLLAHSIEPCPMFLSNYCLRKIIGNMYFYPRVYPADMQDYLPEGMWSRYTYRAERHSGTFLGETLNSGNVTNNEGPTSLPLWVRHHFPSYPTSHRPSEWTREMTESFLVAWGYAGTNTNSSLGESTDSLDALLSNHYSTYSGYGPPLIIPHAVVKLASDEVFEYMQRSMTAECHEAIITSRGYNMWSFPFDANPPYHDPPPHCTAALLQHISAMIGIAYQRNLSIGVE